MKLIKFLGDGDGGVNTKTFCIEGPDGSGYTLCGLSLDNDEETTGTHKVVESKKITCPDCKKIIKFCRDISL